jgi:hypothetical protein
MKKRKSYKKDGSTKTQYQNVYQSHFSNGFGIYYYGYKMIKGTRYLTHFYKEPLPACVNLALMLRYVDSNIYNKFVKRNDIADNIIAYDKIISSRFI